VGELRRGRGERGDHVEQSVGVGPRGDGAVEGLLELRLRDHLHRLRDLGDVRDGYASLEDGAGFGHGSFGVVVLGV
jgi:hypothetical protein